MHRPWESSAAVGYGTRRLRGVGPPLTRGGQGVLCFRPHAADLAAIHGQPSFTNRAVRIESLHIDVPLNKVLSSAPIEVEIDFDHFRRVMEKIYIAAPGGVLFYSVELEVDDGARTITWSFPPESVPAGSTRLAESTALVVAKPTGP